MTIREDRRTVELEAPHREGGAPPRRSRASGGGPAPKRLDGSAAVRLASYVFLSMATLAGCTDLPDPGDAAASAQAALGECRDVGDAKQSCYETRLLQGLERGGVTRALAVLTDIAAADPDVERDGHVYTHAIGIRAYSPDREFEEVFGQCTTLFQSGCYHGVIQARFIAHGVADPDTVRELCASYRSDAGRWLFFQCLHGLGHGLTMFHGHDLPQALEGCDFLASVWERESCYGGAFMENVVSVTHPHHPASEVSAPDPADGERGPTIDDPASHQHDASTQEGGLETWEPLRATDPHYPCSVLVDRYLRACYMMQTSAMLWHNGWDVGEAATTCLGAPESWRPTCFQSLGRDVSSRTLQEPEASLVECRKSPESYREWCYVGLVKNFIDLTAETDAGFAFCRLVEEFAKASCNEAIGEEIWTLRGTDAERRAECAASETPRLREACLRGARVSSG